MSRSHWTDVQRRTWYLENGERIRAEKRAKCIATTPEYPPQWSPRTKADWLKAERALIQNEINCNRDPDAIHDMEGGFLAYFRREYGIEPPEYKARKRRERDGAAPRVTP